MSSQDLIDAIRPLVARHLDDSGATHVVVGILLGTARHYFTFHGPDAAVTPGGENDVFEIGAVTMAFTAALLMELVGDRQVRLSDQVQQFLPADVRVPTYAGQEITLLDLANHSSGLPAVPSNFRETIRDPANPCAHYTAQDLYRFLSEHTLREPIGCRRKFSNLGMGLLGHTLSRAVEQDVESLIRERIAEPLELSDTTVTLDASQRERFVPGHTIDGSPAPPWDMPALVGAGGLRSTARNLLALAEAHFLTKDRSAPIVARPTRRQPRARRRRTDDAVVF